TRLVGLLCGRFGNFVGKRLFDRLHEIGALVPRGQIASFGFGPLAVGVGKPAFFLHAAAEDSPQHSLADDDLGLRALGFGGRLFLRLFALFLLGLLGAVVGGQTLLLRGFRLVPQ